MKKEKIFLLISIIMFPSIVYANSVNNTMPISLVLLIEAFVTIHMSLFVLLPLSKLITNGNSKNVFWKLFIIRIILLLFFDLFITTDIYIIDFISVFIGAFILLPIVAIIKKKNPIINSDAINNSVNDDANYQSDNNILNCPNCGSPIQSSYSFCTNCGISTITVETETTKNIVSYSNFDPMYNYSEDKLVEEFIKKELNKVNFDMNTTLIPADVLKRKNILSLIFSILVFVFISLIFFHFPIYTYLVGVILLFIFYKVTKQYNILKYLKKEVKARPSEKISNIVMNTKNSLVNDNRKMIRVSSIILAMVIPLIIFMNPRIFYEEVENGYAVRFYTFGLTNYTKAVIPGSYKGKNVISLRGNTFSNMPFLKEVVLPDTIVEIRGQAFKNDKKLVKVNIPIKLEYLGGGAFYNCRSIKEVILPDTLTYMGGETFYNAKSLEKVILSQNITEIRGNTFENCTALTSIDIPDNVTRIGGHAFYGNTSLSQVTISENSKLLEIGSSAFRRCDSLKAIRIPRKTSVNYRAFKQSPTIVERFSKNGLNYGELIDDTKYYNNRLLYINVGEKVPISYSNRTLVYKLNAYLKLDSISSKNNSNEFNIIYIDDNNQSISLTLTENVPFKDINQNVAVEIANENALDYSDKVYLKVYFN